MLCASQLSKFRCLIVLHNCSQTRAHKPYSALQSVAISQLLGPREIITFREAPVLKFVWTLVAGVGAVGRYVRLQQSSLLWLDRRARSSG